eukprot:gnl/TRDRNA2_/TRDRNA2_30398_c0_seq1.p1 gnl/TRDRNA2_/TRDRNA2_30398_c0~~gnl/TRDRNA2_/TRDRNA2_30398_c0_seq1.p1  ORF type:complete len:376 (-),score=59.12 gnl/TRDRNA2_/TRDRNA2_30398_c0_seq1:64-1191(-)
MLWLLLLIAVIVGTTHTARLKRIRGSPRNDTAAAETTTFQVYYQSVTTGRGIWKWSNALAAYDKHLLRFAGWPVVGAEVGVHSGGSILMWHAVLGPKLAMNGLDINPDCAQFVDAKTSITIGDQENPKMWESFFTQMPQPLDFLVDDGGHTAPQMLQTTYSVWPRLNPGGVLAIEDILGNQYFSPFFQPLAQFLGAQTDVDSVHLYPYLMITQKAGSQVPPYDPSVLPGAVIPASGRISDLTGIDNALAAAPPGSLVVLENAAWGRFINPKGLNDFFWAFVDLYQPKTMTDEPPGCASTNATVCNYLTTNSPLQAKILGVHILPAKMVIEVPSATPQIGAIRHGTVWLPPLERAQERLAAHLGNGPPARYHPPKH